MIAIAACNLRRKSFTREPGRPRLKPEGPLALRLPRSVAVRCSSTVDLWRAPSAAQLAMSISIPSDHGSVAHLLPPSWRSIVRDWLAEGTHRTPSPAESSDTPSFDVGGFVVGESDEDAVLFGKQSVRRAVVTSTLALLRGSKAALPRSPRRSCSARRASWPAYHFSMRSSGSWTARASCGPLPCSPAQRDMAA